MFLSSVVSEAARCVFVYPVVSEAGRCVCVSCSQ